MYMHGLSAAATQERVGYISLYLCVQARCVVAGTVTVVAEGLVRW